MEDQTNYGISSAASPGSNSILSQPPLQPAAPAAGDGAEDVQMTEGPVAELNIKQDSATPAPGVTSDNPLDAPDGPAPEATQDEEMGGSRDETKDAQVAKDSDDNVANDADGQDSKTKETLESAAREHLISQTHAIVLPSYSTWFDMNTINDIERKAMSEFFNSRNRSKTPAVYKDYRDFMINTYRLNPVEYLTVTACRRNLAGDVCAIMRVHSFLEQWGLINYQVDAEQRPSHVGPPFTGHFKIICDTPRGLQPWQPSADAVVSAGKPSTDTDKKVTATPGAKSDLNLEVSRNIYEASAKGTKLNKTEPKTNGETPVTNGISGVEEATKTPIVKVNCHTCGIDCTRLYYHSSQADPNSKTKYDVCPSCYLEGHLPGNQTSAQFTRMENPTYTTVLDRDAPWSDAEILRLLEGIERMDDDWNEIADHVGTRTREECVLQFLSLDIEGKYADSDLAVNAPTGLAMLGQQGGHLPFSQADNPVMSVVGFLAGLADPASTAAAANKSAEELKRKLRRRLEGGHSEEQAATNGKGKDKDGGDSMDIDIRQDVTTTTTTTTRTTTLATIPMATMGARAAGLVSHEEREMTRLVSAAANLTLQKLELKLKYFNEMEAILQAERRELERGRQQLFLDRLAFKRRVREVQDSLKTAVETGGDQGLKLAQDAMMDGANLTFQAAPGPGAVPPLSSEGQIKSFEA
ncbi:SWIRM domain-containing protein [Colletotrichum higginsianum]|uniref:SWIRM domain-containing protein n=2 Tax=Colletotrichum higginsianum TaxID=80884 RepID=H1VHK3_COLHI|nr:SWIRM domain-containing protein [Colletotrichum higginsianum IMI 349063]OBR12216.1 SWIRM domain-containing protein [Colletotrichum higginsianum IMI 349063]TID00007.1 SWI/SNF and RSC complexes subunit ssr2 [Colletotrichum higginsianum]GJC93893.1 SWIRM domain-containing protein [Colletotrichum higginsianum]CCF39706.1 SWIRM domain-containing protein [Colletotrichum higginsianum]